LKSQVLFLTILFSFTLFIGKSAEAYVQNRTTGDALVRWTSGTTLIDIFINPTNTQGIPTNTVNNIASASVSQWDGKSSLSLRKTTTAGKGQSGLNEIYFSSDPSIFNGSGVVGVTQISYKNNTGEIIEWAEEKMNASEKEQYDLQSDSQKKLELAVSRIDNSIFDRSLTQALKQTKCLIENFDKYVLMSKEGKIVDVKIEYPKNFTEQMLEYSKNYSYLPVIN
jgi:hypothetical protein